MSSSITGIETAAFATKTSLTDKAAFGAAVVKGTLDTLSGGQGAASETPITDKATFGAAVVSGTLAALNGTGAGAGAGNAPITDKATFGAAVVKGTLDTLNATGGKAEKNDYDFQNKVLGAGLTTGKGLLSSGKA